jgi:hypothetical protein
LSAKLVPTFVYRGVSRSQCVRSPMVVISFSRPEPFFFLPSSSSVVLTRLSGPRSRPTTSQRIWYCRESNLDLWICSQELLSTRPRGGQFFHAKYVWAASCVPHNLHFALYPSGHHYIRIHQSTDWGEHNCTVQ